MVHAKGEKKSCVRYLWTGVELIKFALEIGLYGARSKHRRRVSNTESIRELSSGGDRFFVFLARHSRENRIIIARRNEWIGELGFEPVGETDLRESYAGFHGFDVVWTRFFLLIDALLFRELKNCVG